MEGGMQRSLWGAGVSRTPKVGGQENRCHPDGMRECSHSGMLVGFQAPPLLASCFSVKYGLGHLFKNEKRDGSTVIS